MYYIYRFSGAGPGKIYYRLYSQEGFTGIGPAVARIEELCRGESQSQSLSQNQDEREKTEEAPGGTGQTKTKTRTPRMTELVVFEQSGLPAPSLVIEV